ncbi:GPI-anchor transamidase subunit K [Nematocida minor]|uniref:GPI-anchor transamidase subunit K n=1 Tax=Nematocida minor TaxID=1912983 RepID=UPI002220CB82|nr:GPI-anchor transamidase subunit K [Nematocida minor]KAI5189722.1 GPI-anchor transamidase subunit K [Nematocida minor]
MFVLFLLMGAVFCTNKAILINCSWQYENYRHFANVIALQSALEKNGFASDDISVYLKQDLLNDKRMRDQNIETDYFTLVKGVDYTPKQRNTSYFEILNMIGGKDPVLLGADSATNLLIYITGHGGDGFIKYCNRKYFYTDDITDALVSLQKMRKLNRILFIADTCQADTLLDKSRLPDNVTFVSTSLKGESSHSTIFSQALNVFPIDLFVMHLYRLINAGKVEKEETFSKLVEREMPNDLIKSTITVSGPDVPLHDFIFQNSEKSFSLFL